MKLVGLGLTPALLRATIIAHFSQSRGVVIGEGTVLGPGVMVMPNLTIRKGALLRRGAWSPAPCPR